MAKARPSGVNAPALTFVVPTSTPIRQVSGILRSYATSSRRRSLFVASGGSGHDRDNIRHAVSLRRRESYAAPEAHDLDAVSYLENMRHVVADENNRQAPVA